MVKMLFDSCYKRPYENERVIQDANPIKQAALDEARARMLRNQEKQRHQEEFIAKLQQDKLNQ
jgi:hypothetical protein